MERVRQGLWDTEEKREMIDSGCTPATYPIPGLSFLGCLGAALEVGRSDRDKLCVCCPSALRSVAARLPEAPARRVVASITLPATRTGGGLPMASAFPLMTMKAKKRKS